MDTYIAKWKTAKFWKLQSKVGVKLSFTKKIFKKAPDFILIFLNFFKFFETSQTNI